MFLSSADCIQNQLYRNIISGITIGVSNSLDPDQARHFVGPDLGANCFQRLSDDDNTAVGKELIRPGSIMKSMFKTFHVATLCMFDQNTSVLY